jgi:uncharacterized damage-inducible protein DinB
MDAIKGMIHELEQEAKTTRALLELVPSDKLFWKPHQRLMSLGQLALHVATLPGNVSTMASGEGFDVTKASFTPPQPETKEQILAAFEESVSNANKVLEGWDQNKAAAPWKLSKGDQTVFTIPRMGVIRTILLNHWYHHRGQLTVFLRLLDLSLPVTYGRSGDVNPFA